MAPDNPPIPEPPPMDKASSGQPSEFDRMQTLMRRLLKVPKQAIKEDKKKPKR